MLTTHKGSAWKVYPSIEVNEPGANMEKGFPSNRIYTTKYTFLTFLPKNLIEQFRRITNVSPDKSLFFFIKITKITNEFISQLLNINKKYSMDECKLDSFHLFF